MRFGPQSPIEVRLEADAAYAKQYLDRIQPLLAKHFVTANDVFNARIAG